MLTASKNREKTKRRAVAQAGCLANDLTKRAEVRSVSSRWPNDCMELAQRIVLEGERTVPNHDRNLLAKYMPTGALTRRDGTSIAAYALGIPTRP